MEAEGPSGVEAPATRPPWLPCLLAWLVPGLGHLVLGRRTQAAVFALVIGTTFVTGVALSGTVYAVDRDQPLSYLSTFANLGAGPLDAWGRWVTFGELRYSMPDTRIAAAEHERVERRVRRRISQPSHAYGRTFLLTAGVMNLLLMLDVYDCCLGRKTRGSAAEAAAASAVST